MTVTSIARRPARTVLMQFPVRAAVQAIDATGELLAVVGRDHEVRMKPNKAAWRILRTDADPTQPVTSLMFSADSSRIAAVYAGGGGGIRIWNTASEAARPLAWLQMGLADCAMLSPNGAFVAAGTPGSVALWAVGDRAICYFRQRRAQPFAFSPDGRTFLAGVAGNIEAVDLRSRSVQTRGGPGRQIVGLSVSPCGSFVLAHDDRAIRFWRLDRGALSPLKGDFPVAVGEARWSTRPGRVNVIETDGRVVLLDFDVTALKERQLR